MMERRRFLVASLASVAAVPFAAGAQPVGKIARIGLLVTGPRPEEHACVLALRRGFAELGYVEGRTWADRRPEEAFPGLATELVQAGVDIIVSVTAQGLVEAKAAMASVPVVMAASTHPLERGLIASYGRPGANITGLATFTGEMFAKRVQLLVEALPRVSRIAILRLPGEQNELVARDLASAAGRLGLTPQVIEVQEAGADSVPGCRPRKGSGAHDGAGTLFLTACANDGRPRLEAPAAELLGRANGGRRGHAHELRCQHSGELPARGLLCRSHLEGREALRFARRADTSVQP
jgi:hypothetical protein